MPEKLEAWIFSYIIELLIREFNKRFGKTWLAKVVA